MAKMRLLLIAEFDVPDSPSIGDDKRYRELAETYVQDGRFDAKIENAYPAVEVFDRDGKRVYYSPMEKA